MFENKLLSSIIIALVFTIIYYYINNYYNKNKKEIYKKYTIYVFIISFMLLFGLQSCNCEVIEESVQSAGEGNVIGEKVPF